MQRPDALHSALSKLRGLENYERGFAPYGEARYDPQKTGRLLSYAGIDVSGIRIIHVAGTKGKGSTSHYAHAILRALFPEERAGLYTSPHLLRVTERISVNGAEISGEALASIVEKHYQLFRDFGCTWFDAFTFSAMAYFAAAGCRWAVLETGLGGRLDSTNFCRPAVSVITPIGYDHTALLGDTLAAIAFEKAGIIKPGVPSVSARQEESAMSVIRERARECLSRLTEYDRDARLAIRSRSEEGAVFDAEAGGVTVFGARCAQVGDVLPENLILALLAVLESVPRARREEIRRADPEKWAEAVRRAGETVRLPGRMEKRGNLVFDVAHNDQSFRTLFDTLRSYFGAEKIDLCVGILADKELARVAAVIRENAAFLRRVTMFDFPSERPSGGKALHALLEGLPGLDYVAAPEGVAIDPQVLTAIAGSFHTAAFFQNR